MRLICSILFILFQFLYSTIFAQNVSLEKFNAANGLPTSEIISVYKDYRGFLWVGTTIGVSRFDGYRFENFQSALGGHTIRNVVCIKEDFHKKIWIGTHAGLFFLENNQLFKANASSDSIQGINDIFPEENGDMWLATEGGPVFLKSSLLNLCKDQPIFLSENVLIHWSNRELQQDKRRATKIARADDGTVFVCNFNEVFRVEKNKMTRLVGEFGIDAHFVILDIFPVSSSKIYFNEARRGLYRIDSTTITRVPFDSVYRPNFKAQSNARWYLDAAGFYKFYPKEEIVSFHFNTFNIDVTWLSQVLFDENNFYWIATHDGLIKLKFSPFKQHELRSDNSIQEVYSIFETSENKLVLGANRGKVYLYNNENTQFLFPQQKSIVPLAEIFDIYEDSRKWIWFGTGYQGMVVFRNNRLVRYLENDGLHDNSIKKFFRASTGTIYAMGDFGVTEIIVDDSDNVKFIPHKSSAHLSQYGSYLGAVEAPDKTVWFAGEEGLAYLKKGALQLFTLNGKNLFISDIKKDRKGNVWLATGGEGLIQCRFNSLSNLEIIRQYTERDGLNTSTLMNILPAKDGNIWVSSPKGLSFIGMEDQVKNKILNFDEKDGFLKSGYNNLTLFQDKKGIVWAGCSKGLISFNPDSILVSLKKPPIYITGLNLLNSKEAVTFFSDSLKEAIPVNLSLPYNNNSIQISYTSIEFNNSNSLRYYYQLVNFDTGWVYANNERTINYQNLKPGKYQFRVKSINDKSLWSDQEASIDFVINPPFWQRWWFIVCCALAIIVTLFLIYRFLKSKYDTQKILNKFITSLYGKNSPEEIFRAIAQNCVHQLQFEDCVVYQLVEDKNVLIQKAAAGPKSPEGYEIINPIEIPLGKGIVGTVAKTGKAEIISNTINESRYILDDKRRFAEITVPIIVDGEIYGVIDSEHSKKNFYTRNHLHILQTVASICAARISKYLTEEKLRSKIAKDLHDDMGSTLSSINIISKMVLQNNEHNEIAKDYLSKIKDNSGRMLESMSDIVWAINPVNDTLEKVILRMKEFTAEILEPLNINYSFNENGDLSAVELNLNQRKDFFLIFKEAINNAAKYSGCTEVSIELTKKDAFLTLVVHDNGKGFDKTIINSGNGLQNMHSRALAMKAEFQINTQSGGGVTVILSLPLIPKLTIT